MSEKHFHAIDVAGAGIKGCATVVEQQAPYGLLGRFKKIRQNRTNEALDRMLSELDGLRNSAKQIVPWLGTAERRITFIQEARNIDSRQQERIESLLRSVTQCYAIAIHALTNPLPASIPEQEMDFSLVDVTHLNNADTQSEAKSRLPERIRPDDAYTTSRFAEQDGKMIAHGLEHPMEKGSNRNVLMLPFTDDTSPRGVEKIIREVDKRGLMEVYAQKKPNEVIIPYPADAEWVEPTLKAARFKTMKRGDNEQDLTIPGLFQRDGKQIDAKAALWVPLS